MGGITLNSEHGLVILSAAAIAIQCIATGFVAGGIRMKLFTQKFLEDNFGEQHKKDFGSVPLKGGYPDMGNGRYSDKLSYKDWYNFNNTQRAHYNFLEQVGSILALLLIAGIGFPTVAGILGWTYFVGRVLFTIGYISKGPQGRLIGVVLVDLALLGLAGTSIASGLKLWSS